MKKLSEMNYSERKEVAELFANWLSTYTDEVVKRAMSNADEIVANEFAMNLLKELKIREDKEKKSFAREIASLLEDYGTFNQFSLCSNCTTHSNSYRDVLYDMYIATK